MDNDLLKQKIFLEEQLEWCRKQDFILEKMEKLFSEMKALAEYARDYRLTELELDKVNYELEGYKREVNLLERQLKYIFH